MRNKKKEEKKEDKVSTNKEMPRTYLEVVMYL